MPSRDPDCPFCRIAAGVDPDAREVFRNERVIAFFPTEPATLGHTLLAPIEHIPDIWHLSPRTAEHLGRAAVHLASSIKTAMNPEGLNVIQSNGAVATQTVMHLHIHLVPRWSSDELGRIWPPETDFPELLKDTAWDMIKEAARKPDSVEPEELG